MTRPGKLMSEEDFQQRIIETAYIYGWHVAHFRPARTASGWRTAMVGHVGFLDLVLARNGQVLIREVKRHGAKLTPGQKDWVRELGVHGGVWYPGDWDRILKELR
jgi:hypothetical protein